MSRKASLYQRKVNVVSLEFESVPSFSRGNFQINVSPLVLPLKLKLTNSFFPPLIVLVGVS